MRKIGAGSISESSTKTPEKTNQIKDENLSFFENLDVHAVPIIELRHVSSIGFLIGKNASRGRIGKNYEPMGLNKGDAIVLRGDM